MPSFQGKICFTKEWWGKKVMFRENKHCTVNTPRLPHLTIIFQGVLYINTG